MYQLQSYGVTSVDRGGSGRQISVPNMDECLAESRGYTEMHRFPVMREHCTTSNTYILTVVGLNCNKRKKNQLPLCGGLSFQRAGLEKALLRRMFLFMLKLLTQGDSRKI